MALAQINHTYRIGWIGDPRHTPNGVPVVDVRAVANKSKKLPNGEWENQAEHWANLQLWRDDATRFLSEAQVGDQIRFIGDVKTNQWEKDGQKHSKDIIDVEFFKIWKKDGNQQGQSIAGAMQQQGGYQQQGQQQQYQQQGGYQQNDPWGGNSQQGGYQQGQQQQFGGYQSDEPPF